MRVRYWSCTKFADWIRGTSKPPAATGDQWRQWRKKAITFSRVRYWIAEELLDNIQSTLWWPVDKIYNIKYYINNRWVTRTHALTAHPNDIPRGQWCDVGSRFLPCLMNELVDFVEVELAWSTIAWSKESRKKYKPPFYASGWFRWRVWRSAEAGMEYLNWAKDLDNSDFLPDGEKHLAQPTGQALAAREILELYHWWKNVYPNRKDPSDASGWSKWCDDRRTLIKEQDGDEDEYYQTMLSSDNDTPEQREETSRLLDVYREIEKQYDDEDTAMLQRLIAIRNHLWT